MAYHSHDTQYSQKWWENVQETLVIDGYNML